jgi:plasmid stabilization system protein ParE
MSWDILETDPAEQDRERALLFVMRLRGPEYAERWHDGLLRAVANLARFPGPRALPRCESEEERRRMETRILLYRGPDKKPALSVTFRILFTVLDPVQGEESGTIAIQRIRHARSADVTEL